jgi:hypothetical protein
MEQVGEYATLAAARAAALAAARDGGLPVALAMLAESLIQLEAAAPDVSAEVWDAYAAVLAAPRSQGQSQDKATVLPLPSAAPRRSARRR